MEKDMQNEQAQELIQKSEELRQSLKETVLCHLLDCLNTICKEQNLQYFAISRLLAQQITGKDTFPDNTVYNICMMRKDYDRFFQAAQAQKKKLGIEVCPYYDSQEHLIRIHSYISRKERFSSELGTQDIEITIRIDPYDYLPDDPGKRESFLRRQSALSGEYRRLSRFFTSGSGSREKSRFKRGIQNRIADWKRQQAEKELFARMKKIIREFPASIRTYENAPTQTAGRVEILYYRPHSTSEIFPIRTCAFKESSLMVPALPDRFMIGTQDEENSRAAGGKLKALQTFDSLCSENALSYFIMGELAADCTRYGDYAAGSETSDWEIGMLRADFEKITALISQNASDREHLTMRLVREEFPAVHSEDVGLILNTHLKLVPFDHDYPINLYPFDAAPEDMDERNAFFAKVVDTHNTLLQIIDYEKGLTLYKENEIPPKNSWDYYADYQTLRQQFNSADAASGNLYTVYHGNTVCYQADQLLPPARRPFHGFSLLGPADSYLWHSQGDPDFTEYIAAKRTPLLELFDALCQKEGLAYFAIENLLIGAAIYQDTVPGSCDAPYRLGMLRNDYEKCLTCLRRLAWESGISLHEYYDAACKYPLPEKRISLSEERDPRICIQIVPFDTVPEDFYLSEGFKDDTAYNSQRYEKLISYRCGSRQFDDKKMNLSPEERKEYLHYLQTADAREEAARMDAFAQTFNGDERWNRYGRFSLGQSKTIKSSDLFPLQRVPFRGIMVNIPRDYSAWQPMLNDELKRQVSAIQKANMLLLEEFDRVCGELGLGYFVCGGTMLGYMRHSGFIPWDDDIDCAMLRKDYDRFLAEAGPLLKENFFLQTRETDPNIPYLYSKIRLDNTEYATEYNAERDFHIGISMDLFPFDYLPDNPAKRKAFREKAFALSRAHYRNANAQLPYPKQVCKPLSKLEERYIKEQKEKLDYYWSQDLAKTQQDYLDHVTFYNKEGEAGKLRTVASFVPTYTQIDVSDLLPYQRGRFENLDVSVPRRPDIFLTMQYQDYMTPPPKHNQIAHRLVRWATWEESWDKPPKKEENNP